MRKTLTIEIEGTRYKLRQVGARAGSQIVLRLGRLLGPASGGNLEAVLDALSGESFAVIVEAFAAETKIETMLTTGSAIEIALDFDEHFAGNYKALILWIKACFDLNFSSFLGDLVSLFPEGLAATVAGLKRPPGSIGGSGESSSPKTSEQGSPR